MFYTHIRTFNIEPTEAATEGVLQKQVFLKISQNPQEGTCLRVTFLIKLQAFFTELLRTAASEAHIRNVVFFIALQYNNAYLLKRV